MARNKRVRDMSNFEIRGELMKIGKSLSQLGIENGLAKTTVRNALDKPYPKGEQIIAKAIGKTPQEIWPSRYE
ncbi:TPA: helix-turn-helix domain-containing protein [Mannheimia haemolytica]|uniref:Transcriptional regulator n=2 Tax=Mannheimia haemolytica TaxID=75985 RepID=A0A249A1P2_MANHA|nr:MULTISPECIES: helix-turn-helix domain-containing protein [Mannheimia]AWW72203.1 DNA-binding protein [Pasteurellaceae bacterium 12565]AGI33496.2 DNA-binding protein [Mannheimia haemolytica USDA-ARS-USMARC-183]AGK01588.1 putative nlp-like bacteriophage transcriptional regulator [Mannheimia haemolytica M42548]AGQ26410.1 DNA-binding protein [Mannheimia haemolytica D153]AGQ41965.1 DNA-binding protein [Mannheimia haemolytica D174]